VIDSAGLTSVGATDVKRVYVEHGEQCTQGCVVAVVSCVDEPTLHHTTPLARWPAAVLHRRLNGLNKVAWHQPTPASPTSPQTRRHEHVVSVNWG
jgi:hypothetical protein